jgi:putative ABC transport system permease protein
MLFLRLAYRNIFRQKRRSFFTILSIMGSFVLCSMAIGLVYGTYGKVINTFTSGHSGHIQVHSIGYLERPSLFKNIKDYSKIEEVLKNEKEIISFSPRVISSVLSSLEDKTTGAKLIGINPEKESLTTTMSQKITQGKLISQNYSQEVVLGHALAKILNAKINDSIILMTQAADGSMANDSFKVVGILSESSDSMEARNIYVHIEYAQEFLVLGSRIHEVVISLNDFNQAQRIALDLSQKLKEFEVSPWQEIESEFYKAMKADQTGIWINLGILIFIVSIGVLNTVLMTILERTKEFGILKAIGTRPRDIFFMVVLETTMLALVSISIGLIFAIAINYKLTTYGIPYPMPIEIGGMALHHLYSEVTFFNLIIPALVVTLSSIGVSIIPALRAAQIVPVKAIRST